MFAEVYRSIRTHQWRWRLKGQNGKVVATSHDAYHRKDDCLHGLGLVIALPEDTEIRIENTEDAPPNVA